MPLDLFFLYEESDGDECLSVEKQTSMHEILEHALNFFRIAKDQLSISFGEKWIFYDNDSKDLTVKSSGLLEFVQNPDWKSYNKYVVVNVHNGPVECKLPTQIIIDKIYSFCDKQNIVPNSFFRVKPQDSSLSSSPSSPSSSPIDKNKSKSICKIIDCDTHEILENEKLLICPNHPHVILMPSKILENTSEILFCGYPFSFKCADLDHSLELDAQRIKYNKDIQEAKNALDLAKKSFIKAVDDFNKIENSISEESCKDADLIYQYGSVSMLKKLSSQRLEACSQTWSKLVAQKKPEIDLSKTITVVRTIQMKVKFGRNKLANGRDVWILPLKDNAPTIDSSKVFLGE